MFIQFIRDKAIKNKYTLWYIKLCEKALLRQNDIEGELHHIVPRTISKVWIKEPKNIVKLTYREHYIAHLLLVKMFEKYWSDRLIYALSFMLFAKKYQRLIRIPSRKIQKMKEEYSKRNSMKSDETKQKISLKLTGRTKETHEYIILAAEKRSKTQRQPGKFQDSRKKLVEKNKLLTQEERNLIYSHPHTNETKMKLSNDRRGQTVDTCNRVKKMSETKKRKYANMTEEERKKQLGKSKGRVWFYNDELKLSKTFAPDNLPDEQAGWKRGCRRYDR